jgi:hypothetical protein
LVTRPRAAALAGLLALGAPAAIADTLANQAFRIEYDAGGIRSLKRANDVHDTDYIAANAALGRFVLRYRSAPRGDFRELRDVIPDAGQGDARTFRYRIGSRPPALAARSTASAAVGAGGLRALNDGLVPSTSPAAAPVPLFNWSAVRGVTQWVQYTFPSEQDVARAEVFWVAPPQSWRLLYAAGLEWKPVAALGGYGISPNAFTTVEFAPVRTLMLRLEVTLAADESVSLAEWRIGGDPPPGPAHDLAARASFTLSEDALDWRLALANESDRTLEIGDLALPLPFAERTPPRTEIYTRKLLRHSLVAGHGSWVFWQRSNGVGPYLVLTPLDGAAFEYFDSSGGGTERLGVYTPYLHAQAAAAAAVRSGGNWRLPVSALRLAPKGEAGSTRTYRFRFRWAKDFAGVRDVLYGEGKLDAAVVPAMVVPSDLHALVALRTQNVIQSIVPEHPQHTRSDLVATREDGTRVYRVSFSRLGENMLTLRYADGRWTTLEFFVTEPLETLIRKRAAFLVERHQHTDDSKWYVGVYSDWDQKNEVLRGPDDRDSLSAWLTDANDDAGNARPAFVASKNVFFPDEREIRSLELYIAKYLWGGMQMTEEEKYPYAIYGIPNWKVNRASPDAGRNGRAHVWRIYDYPHIALLYYRMYQLARFYPEKLRHLDAAAYLKRAYRTAVAYWTVPLEVEKWSADAVGTMNEAFLPELIGTLAREGHTEWADTLRRHWEGKVERFVNRPPNLYGSEFAFDSTGFESTGAFAKYALERALRPGEALPADAPDGDLRRRVSYEAARRFMEFQLRLNMSDRGWLETTYYQLGSDYRASLSYLLSYMSQLGGWSILDYALHFADDPTDYLRLGYASSLSSWALVNSGTAESGYGYWFPSRRNDGASGGGFIPEAIGRGWIGKQMPRGAWHYSAEQDVGFCGALRTHATIVADDPSFGEFAYGGALTREGGTLAVIPRDGLRARFHVLRGRQRLHMLLERDGYAREQPIRVSDDLSRIEFTLENRAGTAHATGLELAGLPQGTYEASLDGTPVATFEAGARNSIALPVASKPASRVRIVRAAR